VSLRSLIASFFFFSLAAVSALAANTPRQVIAQAALAEADENKHSLITSLAGQGDDTVRALFAAWREDALFIYSPEGGAKTAVQLVGEKDAKDAQEALRVADGAPLKNADGQPLRLAGADLTAVEHDSSLRRAMKTVIDLLDLSSPNTAKRIQAAETIGHAQDAGKLAPLQARLPLETDAKVKISLRVAIALIQLKDPGDETKFAALEELRQIKALSTADFIEASRKEAEASAKPAIVTAARSALRAVEGHRSAVNFWGTLFRGLSTGSVLLVVALGLAITFGLMRVINMAHGELIAVGAYTTYVIQNIFGSGLTLSPFGVSFTIPGINAGGWAYESYFLVALPLSFLAAAVVGIALERSVIQFLYRRPLESLLATWGVSLVLQQVLKLIFGSNNVQVSSPSYLSGNWIFFDIIFTWNRVFVIGFAVVIVIGVWLVLTKTPLGLLIRAVMQNRGMASCMGVRTERVNMMTFGLGSGLAGLAGAFISQLANVGPSLGQNYIVDCFMTVVVGGVGSIGGTIVAASGIGMADQSLQQILGNPVLGKILVLLGIILFLQWRPAGIFVTKSRSLDE